MRHKRQPQLAQHGGQARVHAKALDQGLCLVLQQVVVVSGGAGVRWQGTLFAGSVSRVRQHARYGVRQKQSAGLTSSLQQR